jgi:cold shock CspA family protein
MSPYSFFPGGMPQAEEPPPEKAKGKGKGKGKKGKGKDADAATTMAEAGEGSQPSGGTRLHVKNLVEETTSENIRELFKPFGKVLDAQIKTNEIGKCRGFGFVVMSSKAEADAALENLNGKPGPAGGGPVTVVLPEAKGSKGGKGDGKGGKDGKGKGKGGKSKDKGAPQAPAADPMAAFQAQQYAAAMASLTYGGMPGFPGMPNPMMYGGMSPYSPYGGMYPFPMLGTPTAGQMPPMSPYSFFPGGMPQAEEPPPEKAKGKGKGKGKKGKGKDADAAPHPNAPPPDKVFVGTLKSFSTINGYGFIESEEAKQLFTRDVYVDSELVRAEKAWVKDKVSFNINLSGKGQPRACNIKVVESSRK